jgi:hypothetical protein
MIDAKLSSSTHPVILSNVSPQSLLTNDLAERVSSGTCNDDCGDTPNQQEPDDPNDAAPDLHSDTACGLTPKLRHAGPNDVNRDSGTEAAIPRCLQRFVSLSFAHSNYHSRSAFQLQSNMSPSNSAAISNLFQFRAHSSLSISSRLRQKAQHGSAGSVVKYRSGTDHHNDMAAEMVRCQR